MAANLNLVFAGPPEQHVKVSVTPMAKLQSVLEQACTKLRPALDPAACQLVLHEGRNKRVVDLQVPFRLANIPTTAAAKLEVVKVAAATPTTVPAPQAAAPQVAPAHLPHAPEPQAPASLPATTSAPLAPTPAPEAPPAPPAPEPAPAPAQPPAPPAPSAAIPPAPAATAAFATALEPTAHPPQPSASRGAGVASAPDSAPSASRQLVEVPAWLKALGADREVVIYSKAALDAVVAAAAEASGGDAMDVTDDFFDLTPEDLARISKAEKARKEEASQLLTRALREAAERNKAASYGPIPVRVHLPDNTILQAAFSALEPLSKLQELLGKLLVAEMGRPGAFYLYTTPPKQTLKDLDVTFFKAQLVPAAHIHVHVNEGKGPSGQLLRPEALQQVQTELTLDTALPGQAPFAQPGRSQEAGAGPSGQGQGAPRAALGGGGDVDRAGAAAESEKVPGVGAEDKVAAPKFTAAGTKVPKWLKMG